MQKLITKRIFAYFIDYLVFMVYAILLMGLTLLLATLFNFSFEEIGPIKGQIIGFITLTLPVVLYSFFSESGKKSATIGKRIMELKVIKNSTRGNILLRNIIKFLPWEIAHFGVHWIYYFSLNHEPIQLWIWVFVFVPELIIMTYYLVAIINKGEKSVYDYLANTMIVTK